MPIVIPDFGSAIDRGDTLYDKCTGSSLTKPVAYCADFGVCGNTNYTVFRSSLTVNALVDCTKTPVAQLSYSGFFLDPADPATLIPGGNFSGPTIEDRGGFLYDTITKSTYNLPVDFCRDLRGCGVKEYTFFRAGVNINSLESCKISNRANLQISGFIKNPDGAATDIGAMVSVIETYITNIPTCPATTPLATLPPLIVEMSNMMTPFMEATYTVCPVT